MQIAFRMILEAVWPNSGARWEEDLPESRVRRWLWNAAGNGAILKLNTEAEAVNAVGSTGKSGELSHLALFVAAVVISQPGRNVHR